MQSSTNYPDESSTGQVQQGIDIQQALSILSARSEPAEDHNDGCGFCQGSQIPESAKTMGQTIDMFASGAKEDEMHDDNRLVDERTERLSKIRVELDAMTDRELLQTVLKTQEDRVATYREYER